MSIVLLELIDVNPEKDLVEIEVDDKTLKVKKAII